jgi:uncharacterized protein YjcR
MDSYLKRSGNNRMAKRGAPKRNQNAKTHGFYSRVLDEAEKLQLEEAVEVEGLDQEKHSVKEERHFDRLSDHTSTGSVTTLRQAQ